MAQDALPPPPPTAAEPPPLASPFRPSRFVIAGVFGACALGVGLGLLARPAAVTAPQVAAAEPARPALQVVVDDHPAPAGPLLEVLPDDVAPTDPTPAVARLIPVEPLAARAAGLVRVDAVVAPASPSAAAAPPATVATAMKPAPVARKLVVLTPPAPAPAKAVDKPKARSAPATRLARADAKPTKAAKAEPGSKAHADAKPTRLADLARSAKAAPRKAVEKAKAVARRKTRVEQAEAKPRLLKAKVVKVPAKPQKAKPQQAKAQKAKLQKPKVEKAKVQKAKVERARTGKPPLTQTKVAKAAPPKARTQVARAPAPKAVAVAPRRIAPRGEGPLRVARAERCAAADPGEALVCADRRLAARDRQLQQAYRDAEAAGVPASALRRQQTRWVQARAAAAREAPWAVEDVYVARISELNDLSRDAQEN